MQSSAWYEAHGQQVKELSERALEEYESCALTAAFLEKYGFPVETFNCDIVKASSVIKAWRTDLDA